MSLLEQETTRKGQVDKIYERYEEYKLESIWEVRFLQKNQKLANFWPEIYFFNMTAKAPRNLH